MQIGALFTVKYTKHGLVVLASAVLPLWNLIKDTTLDKILTTLCSFADVVFALPAHLIPLANL